MKKIIVLMSLLSLTSLSFASFLKLGKLGSAFSYALSRFTGIAPRAFATNPHIPVKQGIEIDLNNPPSLMQAVREQNYNLIKAALEKGVPLTELDIHGKNASGYAYVVLQEYERKMMENSPNSAASYATRHQMAAIVGLFEQNTARLLKAKKAQD